MSLADVANPWHDLYALVGAASATLIGLLFVAASVGAGFFTHERHHALRAFLSPSVVHFSCVLAACLVAVAPIRSWWLLGALVGGVGLFGVAYAALVWRSMVRHGFTASIDLEDRIWYAAMPAVAYAVMAGGGGAFLLRTAMACGILAVSMGLLLLIGIRNAWDITVWTLVRPRE